MGNSTQSNSATPPSTTANPWSVDSIVSTLPGGAPPANTTSPIPFFHMLARLKTTKREGWRRFGIAQGESISDHMYRMSLITMFCPAALASQLDIPRCVQMALVHDMAEALVGDITPMDGVPKDEKSRRESATMDYFVGGLLGRVQGATSGEALKAVWQEYEDGVTLEARFVHDVDKIELLLQMVEYEKEKDGELDLGEFSWVATKVELPEMKVWANEILTEREKFWEGKPHKSFVQGAVPEKQQVEAMNEYYGKLEDKA